MIVADRLFSPWCQNPANPLEICYPRPNGGVWPELITRVPGFRDDAKQLAIARLIAAAPDLLQLVIQYRDDLRHPPAEDSRQRRLEAISATIAQATGQ